VIDKVNEKPSVRTASQAEHVLHYEYETSDEAAFDPTTHGPSRDAPLFHVVGIWEFLYDERQSMGVAWMSRQEMCVDVLYLFYFHFFEFVSDGF
jgi:hypothetical protein